MTGQEAIARVKQVAKNEDADADDKRVLKSLKQGRFGKAVIANEGLKNDLVELLGLDAEKLIVSGPPASTASDAEWENRARAFWSAVA